MIRKKKYWLIEFVRMIEETGEFGEAEIRFYKNCKDVYIYVRSKERKDKYAARIMIHTKTIILLSSLDPVGENEVVRSREEAIGWLRKYGK